MLKNRELFNPHLSIIFILNSSLYLNISINIQNGGLKFEKNGKKPKQSPIFIKKLVKNLSMGISYISFGENCSSLNIQNGGQKYEKQE